MSDTSQGDGWWQASDGKWYPPHLHPDAQPWSAAPAWAGTFGADAPTPDAGAPANGHAEATAETGTYWGAPATDPVPTAPTYGPPPAYGQAPPYGPPPSFGSSPYPPAASYAPAPGYGQPAAPPYGVAPGYGQPPPYGAQPYGAQPYGAQPYGAPPYGAPPYGAPPYGAPPYGAPPYGAPPGYAMHPGWGSPAGVYLDEVLRLPLAPWWKRLVAIIIDGFIVGLTVIIVVLIFTAALGSSTQNSSQPVSRGAAFGALFVAWFFLSIPGAIYYAALNGSRRGQTVGKMALGIAVRDARTGGPIGFWRALGRNLITVVFAIPFSIPYLLDSLAPLWDRRRQAWHDKVAHSVVVEVRS